MMFNEDLGSSMAPVSSTPLRLQSHIRDGCRDSDGRADHFHKTPPCHFKLAIPSLSVFNEA